MKIKGMSIANWIRYWMLRGYQFLYLPSTDKYCDPGKLIQSGNIVGDIQL